MLEVLLILALIGLNGVFAMSEIAVVSARKSRLQHLSEEGNKRARMALDLAENPGRFLSTVQIGITLVGVLAGAYGGVALAEEIEPLFAGIAVLAPHSDAMALTVIVAGITYLSLVVGELVPKHVGLRDPEAVAMLVARPMKGLSFVASPLVSLLSGSTDLLLRLFNAHGAPRSVVTEQEISVMLAEGAEAGVFDATEREIVERVFRFADLPVAAVMTPRLEVECVKVDESRERLRSIVVHHPHTRLIVCRENLDNPVGMVHVKDLLAQVAAGREMEIEPVLRQPPYVPETVPAIRVLERFKSTGQHLAIVVDEYGGMAGLVTLHDILEGIVGDVPWTGEQLEPPATQREDGSWLIDGMMPIDDLKELLDIRELQSENGDGFHTVGGLVVTLLGRIPTASDWFVSSGFRFEVIDMDGRRVDKVLVSPVPSSADSD